MNIEQFQIQKGSKLIGRSIQESGIRDKAACLVIGIERGETSLKNPRESVTVKPDFSDKPDCRPDDLFLPEPEARIFLPAPRLRRRHFL